MQKIDSGHLKAQMLHLPPFEDDYILFHAVMFIDPGTVGTGMAFWEDISTQPRATSGCSKKPDFTDAWVPKKKLPWRERAGVVIESFVAACRDNRPEIAVIEFPVIWGSPRSIQAAVRGDLMKLIYLVGRLEERAKAESRGCTVVDFTPNEWKQQLSKDAVDLRIKRVLGEEYPEHTSDAVGMGLAVQGLLDWI